MSAIAFLVASLGLGFAGPGKYSIKSLCDKKCTDGSCGTSCTPKNPTTPEVVVA